MPWARASDQLAATSLMLSANHVDRVYDLPPIHKDPFDRILVAQAAEEGLTFVTTDREIRKYPSNQLRVLV